MVYLILLIAFFPNPLAPLHESKYSRYDRALNKAKNRLPKETLSSQPRGVFGIVFHVADYPLGVL
jgi:hypothetical protein